MSNTKQQDFSLRGEDFIELNKLLKLLALVQSGGEAKMVIKDGLVLINKEVDTRIRRKLRPGDIVEIGDNKISIV